MLQVKASCYVFVGNGPGKGGRILQHPAYDFNDEVLPLGARCRVNVVEPMLARHA